MSLCEFSYTRSRQAAWLGLLAILLLFVAPVISKSLADRRGGDSMMMHHAMGMEMEMEMAGMPAMDQPMPDHHPLSMMDDSACGYCVLLAHLPLDMLVLPLLWSALQAAKPPSCRWCSRLPHALFPAISTLAPRRRQSLSCNHVIYCLPVRRP